MGVLAPYTDVVIPPDANWSKIKEEAWEAAVRERYETVDEQS